MSRKQPMMATHTPTPWRINGHYSRPLPDKPKGSQIVSDRGDGFEFHIAAVGTHPGINAEQARANAALIVEAVNNYASLKARIAELEAELASCRDMQIDELKSQVKKLMDERQTALERRTYAERQARGEVR